MEYCCGEMQRQDDEKMKHQNELMSSTQELVTKEDGLTELMMLTLETALVRLKERITT